MEEWKQFKKTRQTIWEVSNFGNLKKNGEIYLMPIGKYGYYFNSNLQYLHRIVAFNFLENPLNKPCVNHKDGNKLNNHINNLEWVTWSENSKHSVETGLQKHLHSEEHGNSKLRNKQVEEIKKLLQQGISQTEIAKKFKVSRPCINLIANNKRWKHLH